MDMYLDDCVDEYLDICMDVYLDDCVDVYLDICMDVYLDDCVDGYLDTLFVTYLDTYMDIIWIISGYIWPILIWIVIWNKSDISG